MLMVGSVRSHYREFKKVNVQFIHVYVPYLYIKIDIECVTRHIFKGENYM